MRWTRSSRDSHYHDACNCPRLHSLLSGAVSVERSKKNLGACKVEGGKVGKAGVGQRPHCGQFALHNGGGLLKSPGCADCANAK